MKQRNSQIELFRVMLMFGICLLHAITMCGHTNPRVSALLLPCVNGFVFISGWFEIKYSFRKFAKIVGTSCYAGALVLVLEFFFCPNLISISKEGLVYASRIMFGQWFFVSYLALMLVAPGINYIIESIDQKTGKAIAIPFILLSLWNWTADLPYIEFIPRPVGFGSYTPLSLVSTYVAARFIRKYNVLNKISIKAAIGAIVVLSLMFAFAIPIPLSAYSSWLSVAFAALWFKVYISISDSSISIISGIIKLVSPSMFTIYLLHAHGFGFSMMTKLETRLLNDGCSMLLMYIIVAFTVFFSGILLDLPRRFVCFALSKKG